MEIIPFIIIIWGAKRRKFCLLRRHLKSQFVYEIEITFFLLRKSNFVGNLKKGFKPELTNKKTGLILVEF